MSHYCRHLTKVTECLVLIGKSRVFSPFSTRTGGIYAGFKNDRVANQGAVMI